MSSAPSLDPLAHSNCPPPPQERLRRVLVEARAGHYFERACSVCDDLGVAFFEEVVQSADEIADRLKMKKLECDRFLRAMAAARSV